MVPSARSVWLIRHAESDWNVRGLVQGQADESTLSRRGRRQSRHLARNITCHDVAALYCSDLRRARQTAGPLARRLGVELRLDARLRERHYGLLQGEPVASLHSTLSGIDGGMIVDPDAGPPGGESLRDLWLRARAFASWLRAQPHDGDVVVVTHGGTVRALTAAVRGVAVDRASWEPVPNCTIRRLPLGTTDPGTLAAGRTLGTEVPDPGDGHDTTRSMA